METLFGLVPTGIGILLAAIWGALAFFGHGMARSRFRLLCCAMLVVCSSAYLGSEGSGFGGVLGQRMHAFSSHAGPVGAQFFGFGLLLATIAAALLATDWLGLSVFMKRPALALSPGAALAVATLPPAVERLRPRGAKLRREEESEFDLRDDAAAGSEPDSALAVGEPSAETSGRASEDEAPWGVRTAIDEALSDAEGKETTETEPGLDWGRFRRPPGGEGLAATEPELALRTESPASSESPAEIAASAEIESSADAVAVTEPVAAAEVESVLEAESLSLVDAVSTEIKRRRSGDEDEEPAEEEGESDDDQADEEEDDEEEDEAEDDEEEDDEQDDDYDDDAEEDDLDDDVEDEDVEDEEEFDDEEEDEDEEDEEDEEEEDDDEEDDPEDDEDDEDDDDEDDEEDDSDVDERDDDPYLRASADLDAGVPDAPSAVPSELPVESAVPADEPSAVTEAAAAAVPAHAGLDESFRRAVDCVLEQGRATISLLQENLGVRYFEAAKLLDQLEQQGIIGQYSGSLARPVLISKQAWDERTRSSA